MSLSLEEAVRQAAKQSTGVLVARERSEQASARVTQSKAALLPSMGGAVSQSERTFNINSFGVPFPSTPGAPLPELIGPVQNFDARVRVVQTILDLSAWRQLQAARHGLAVHLSEAEADAEQAAGAAALAYVRAARAAAMASAREADLDLAQQLESLAQVQVRAGTAAEIDILRAQTQVTSTQGQLSQARNQLERARIELALSIGEEPSTPIELQSSTIDTVTSLAPGDRDAAIQLAISRRPELQAEHARVRQAGSEVAAIGAERWPRLDASADYGASGVHGDDAIATRQVAIQLSLPMFDGLRREGRAREQRASAREAELRSSDLVRQVASEVEGALLDVASGLEQQGIARQQIALAEKELEQARTRFVSGLASNIEVIGAQASLNHARDADIAARSATASARISLARAVGVAQSVR
jgi:outer membrane protein TolC